MMFATKPDMVNKYKKNSLIGEEKIIIPNKEMKNTIDDTFSTLLLI